jgi:hypothetical protein
VAFTVVYDACVLYPAPLRDLLLRVAMTGIVRARWSETILDECFRSIAAQRPDLAPEALARTRELMNRAVPDCLVTGFEDLAGAVCTALVKQASALRRPPLTTDQVLDALLGLGLVQSAAKLRSMLR